MNVKVFRFDPSTDAAPYYTEGEVAWHEGMTALEALIQVYENVEAFTHDYSCGCRLCGRCACMLNGKPALICATPVADEELVFEPLKGYPVIRDLIVDKSTLDNKLSALYDRTHIEPFTEETITPAVYSAEDNMTMYKFEFCSRCGVCNAGCPALEQYPDEYVGPAGMLAIAYRHLDPLDQGDRVMEAVSKGLFRCIECGMCDMNCAQQDISHVEMWQRLKEAARERGIVPSYAN